MCEHVYKNMGTPLCPHCGKETREIDWKQQEELHKDWIASGKSVAQGWWSI